MKQQLHYKHIYWDLSVVPTTGVDGEGEMTSNICECDKPSTKLEGTLTGLHTIIMKTSISISWQWSETYVVGHGVAIVFCLVAC